MSDDAEPLTIAWFVKLTNGSAADRAEMASGMIGEYRLAVNRHKSGGMNVSIDAPEFGTQWREVVGGGVVRTRGQFRMLCEALGLPTEGRGIADERNRLLKTIVEAFDAAQAAGLLNLPIPGDDAATSLAELMTAAGVKIADLRKSHRAEYERCTHYMQLLYQSREQVTRLIARQPPIEGATQ